MGKEVGATLWGALRSRWHKFDTQPGCETFG